MATGTRTAETTAESELRAAARRRGVTMKELAAMMGVSAGYLSQFANGGRPWTPKMRQKVAAVLGEVPGQGIVYRMVVHGAGGPGRSGRSGGPAVRVGGRVPWGAKAEYAYRAGYDGMGRLSMTPVLMPGYSAMLKQPEPAAA